MALKSITFAVVEGLIAEQTVDAIVNSVGSEFDLSQGALSRSILKAAGDGIQRELLSNKKPDVRCGQVTTTKGHNLSCSFVFHGVLKVWNNTDAMELLQIFIRNCLLEADNRRLESIAIPAVGTGLLGFPSDLVVDCLVNEAVQFISSNQNSTVNEIRFVVYEKDQKTADIFNAKLDQIERELNDDNDPSKVPLNPSASLGNHLNGQEMLSFIKKPFEKKAMPTEEVKKQRADEEDDDADDEEEYGDDKIKNNFEDDTAFHGNYVNKEALQVNLGLFKRNFLAGNRPYSVLTQEGITIELVIGAIEDQTADAIVNSVGSEFDLSQGALSHSILETAGDGIQVELLSNKSPDVLCGEVTTTKGYDLSCRFVLHGVLKEWDDDDAMKLLQKFIRNCLLEADNHRLESIAIPAVGTGILGFPSDLVVDCLFNEADQFSASNPNTTVNEIRFVVYEKDQKTFKAFGEKMDRILPGDDEAGVNDDGDESINDFDDEDEAEEVRNNFEERIRDLQQKAKSSAAIFTETGSAFPSSWKPIPDGKQYGITELSSNESEFKMVTKRLMETKGTATIRGIIKIERIENRTMFQLYSVLKGATEERNGKQVENERLLWHGTAKQSLGNIYLGGFNRGYCGKNAVAYGKGVYFARDFSYSAQPTYSPPDESGTRYVFLCRVLTGTFMVGNSTMVEPEMKVGTDFRYDSTVDSISSPSIFVVFKDAQAYPEYLVSFH